MQKGSAVFALAMGIIMVIVWIVSIASGRLDLGPDPFEALALLAAESSTALALLAGGVGVLKGTSWGTTMHVASLGMLLYTSIYSTGVFVDVLPAAAFFAVLSLATVSVILALIAKCMAAAGGGR